MAQVNANHMKLCRCGVQYSLGSSGTRIAAVFPEGMTDDHGSLGEEVFVLLERDLRTWFANKGHGGR